jgi:hypothetical protein
MKYGLLLLLLAALPTKSAITVAGKPVDLSGPLECTRVASGTLYDQPMASWTVLQSGAGSSLNVTLFRMRTGREMFNISVAIGNKSHFVSSVKVGRNGQLRGSGGVKFVPAGAGGGFIINATTDAGVKISGTVVCPYFASPVGNG